MRVRRQRRQIAAPVVALVGDDCNTSGVIMLCGPDATRQSLGVKSLEEQPVAAEMARELGHKLAQAPEAKWSDRPTSRMRATAYSRARSATPL